MISIRIQKNCIARKHVFSLNVAMYMGGKTSVLFGPSGSGKTLTMRCIGGLERPDSGKIAVGDRIFYDSARGICLAPRQRGVGYMFQDYALFPHMTVLQNVAYARSGLFGRRLDARQKEEALRLLSSFGIERVASLYPREISGGQQQRAALARAVNARPCLLLLDEPFSALDPMLRENTRREILQILDGLAIPAIVITHDPGDVDVFAGDLALYAGGEAKLVRNYAEIRREFPDAASCLRFLQGCRD